MPAGILKILPNPPTIAKIACIFASFLSSGLNNLDSVLIAKIKEKISNGKNKPKQRELIRILLLRFASSTATKTNLLVPKVATKIKKTAATKAPNFKNI